MVALPHVSFDGSALRDAVRSMKPVFVDSGFGRIWDVLRDHVLSYRVWLFCCLPALLLEELAPAEAQENRRANFWLDFTYPVLAAIFALPFTAVFVEGIERFYRDTLPFLDTGLLDGKPLWLQVLGAFLVTDFTFYACHYLRHRVRWLWHFHAVHHSQEAMNPMTTHRTHAAEVVINAVIRFVPLAFVGGSEASWTIYVLLNGFWGYFIHANIRTNLGPLRYVVVTPQFHRVHHSKLEEHWDRNFGERLILWDWLFGTMHPDLECYPPTGVRSVDRWAVETQGTVPALVFAWSRQLAYPFYKIAVSLADSVRVRARLRVWRSARYTP